MNISYPDMKDKFIKLANKYIIFRAIYIVLFVVCYFVTWMYSHHNIKLRRVCALFLCLCIISINTVSAYAVEGDVETPQAVSDTTPDTPQQEVPENPSQNTTENQEIPQPEPTVTPAEEVSTPTAEPLVSAEPETTVAPSDGAVPMESEQPVESQIPVESAAPEEVVTPDGTAAPETTVKPEGSEEPVISPLPTESATPLETTEPLETTAPDETTEPTESAEPEETEIPEPEESSVPEETAEPEESEIPETEEAVLQYHIEDMSDIYQEGYIISPAIYVELQNNGTADLEHISLETALFSITEKQSEYTIAAGESIRLQLLVPTGLSAGVYTDTIRVTVDSVEDSAIEIPVEIEIYGAVLPLTIQAPDLVIRAGEELPVIQIEDYTVTGFVGADTIEVIQGIRESSYLVEDTSIPGIYESELLEELSSERYEITFIPGKLTIQNVDANETFFTIESSQNELSEIYNAPITIRPTGIDGYNLVKMDVEGEFAETAVIDTETMSGTVELYFGKMDETTEVVVETEPILFVYALDMTAPQITEVQSDAQELNGMLRANRKLTLQVTVGDVTGDGLESGSGVAQLTYLLDGESYTAQVIDQTAQIEIGLDFEGELVLFCEDMAGNQSEQWQTLLMIDMTAPALDYQVYSVAEKNENEAETASDGVTELELSPEENITGRTAIDRAMVRIHVSDDGTAVSGIDQVLCTINQETYQVKELVAEETKEDGAISKAYFDIWLQMENDYYIDVTVMDAAGNSNAISLYQKVITDDVISIVLPTTFSYTIDPYEFCGMGQIFSEGVQMINNSGFDVVVNINAVEFNVNVDPETGGQVKNASMRMQLDETGETYEFVRGISENVGQFIIPSTGANVRVERTSEQGNATESQQTAGVEESDAGSGDTSEVSNEEPNEEVNEEINEEPVAEPEGEQDIVVAEEPVTDVEDGQDAVVTDEPVADADSEPSEESDTEISAEPDVNTDVEPNTEIDSGQVDNVSAEATNIVEDTNVAVESEAVWQDVSSDAVPTVSNIRTIHFYGELSEGSEDMWDSKDISVTIYFTFAKAVVEDAVLIKAGGTVTALQSQAQEAAVTSGGSVLTEQGAAVWTTNPDTQEVQHMVVETYPVNSNSGRTIIPVETADCLLPEDGTGDGKKEDEDDESDQEKGKALADFAKQFVGNPYVWGGTDLVNGCDCSGFVMSVFASYGVLLPHSSDADQSAGYEVAGGLANARPGDLICYETHVGIYIGDGKIVNALNEEAGIVISNAEIMQIVTVRRVL